MKDLRENKNPFTINGYLGRKWYFILGIIIAAINGVLQFTLCRSIFTEIMQLTHAEKGYCIYEILTSGFISKGEAISYAILLSVGLILSFINNKKRITDVLGKETHSYLIAGILALLTVSLMFLNSNSALFNLLYVLILPASCILLLLPGKLMIAPYEEPMETDACGNIETKKAVSFWKRLLAYFIDASCILAPISLFALKINPDLISKIGDFSILTGLAIFVLYFGIMNSEICKGQTLAKSVLGIKVVDEANNYLPLNKSILRAFVLAVCVMMPAAISQLLAVKDLSTFVKIIYVLVITAGTIFYLLFLFNFKTRQTLHDLTVKSYVVTTRCQAPLKDNKINATPVVFAVLIALMCGMFTSLGLIGLSRMTMPAELISNTEKELNIKITKNSSVTSYKTGKSTLTVFIPVKDINDEQLAKKVSEYLKNKTDENTGTINVLLYKFASFGNASLLKKRVYTQRAE